MTTTTTTAALKEIVKQDRDIDRMIIHRLGHLCESADLSWESAEEAGDTAAMLIWESRAADLLIRLEDAYRTLEDAYRSAKLDHR